MMFTRRRLLGAAASVLALLACSLFVVVTLEETSTRHRLERQLDGVDASNGINEREANEIAWAYFMGYVGSCGGPDKGTLIDGEWIIPVAFGIAGKPMDSPIRINARSGAIGQVGGPSFRSYGTFRLILLWGVPLEVFKRNLENYYPDTGSH